MPSRTWQQRWLRWPVWYPLIGIVIIGHQTFVANEAQPWLLIVAVGCLGIQIPWQYSKSITTLAQNNMERSLKQNGESDAKRP